MLADLHRGGIHQINYAIASANGALHERIGRDVMVLFNYIDGVRVETFDAYQLGELIGRVDAQTGRIERSIAQENFAPEHAEKLWRDLAHVRDGRWRDDVRVGLRHLLAEMEDEIARNCQRTRVHARL